VKRIIFYAVAPILGAVVAALILVTRRPVDSGPIFGFTADGAVAEHQLAEFDRLVRDHFADRSDAEAVPMTELLKRARSQSIVILDTRPASEYASGHIAGAISVPVDDLQRRLRELPRDKEYVAYCRGPYCVYADRAVELLRTKGRRARRLLEGFPEWKAAGFPIEGGAPQGR